MINTISLTLNNYSFSCPSTVTSKSMLTNVDYIFIASRNLKCTRALTYTYVNCQEPGNICTGNVLIFMYFVARVLSFQH